MNVKQYIGLWVCIIIVFMGSGCRKFLETKSENNVSVSELFTDYEGARTAIIGCYNKVKSSSYYVRDFYVYPELTGGNIKYAITKFPSLTFTYNFINTSLPSENNMNSFYTQAYSIIYSTNSVLQNIDKVTNGRVEQINRIKADAYTIRAMAHFDLVRVFAQNYSYTPNASHRGIVIKTKNSDSVMAIIVYSSVDQVYNQVLNDLDSALSLYSKSIFIYPSGDAKTWLSADAAKALKARVCLYKGDYTQAFTLSSALINGGKYSLIPNYSYVASWRGKNISSESIFELAFGKSSGGGYGDYFNFTVPQSLYSQFAATTDLTGMYDEADVRGHNSLFQDTILNGTTYSFSKKYFGTSDSVNNIKVIRLSELYLIAAEAAVQADPVNGLATAATYLNTIRTRANPSATSFTASTQQEMIDEIFNERRRELCFEGHLFFDIARLHKNLIRKDCNSTTANLSYPDSRFACTIPFFH